MTFLSKITDEWDSRRGPILIADMDDDHLSNVIRMVARHCLDDRSVPRWTPLVGLLLEMERRPDWAARPAERLPRVFATRDDAWECYERMSDEKKDAAWSRGWR